MSLICHFPPCHASVSILIYTCVVLLLALAADPSCASVSTLYHSVVLLLALAADPSSPTCGLDNFSDGKLVYTGCTCLPFPPRPQGASLPAKGELVLSVGIYELDIERNNWPVTNITLAPNKYYQVAPPGFLQRWGLPAGSPSFAHPQLLASGVLHRKNLLPRSRPEQRTFPLPNDPPGLLGDSSSWFAEGEEDQGGSGSSFDPEPSTLDGFGGWGEMSAGLEKGPPASVDDILAHDYLDDYDEPSLSYYLAI